MAKIVADANTSRKLTLPYDFDIPNLFNDFPHLCMLRGEGNVFAASLITLGSLMLDLPIEFKLHHGHHLIMSYIDYPYHLVTFDITQGDLTLNYVAPKTSFCLKYLEKSYTFINTGEEPAAFGNIHKFIEICENVNSFFTNEIPVIGSDDLPLEKIAFLRDYQKLARDAVNLFMKQNGKVSSERVDSFINNNFCKLTVTKSLAGSNLDSKGPYKVLDEVFAQHIYSTLKLADVELELAGADAKTDDAASD